MSATRPLRYAGKYPCPLAVEDALRETIAALRSGGGVQNFAALRYGGFRTTGTGDDEVSEDVYASPDECAYVRWLDFAVVCGVEHAAALAGWLSANGYDAIRFSRARREPVQEVVDLLGLRVAEELAVELAGRAYVVPLMVWDAETARAILTDVQREVEQAAVLHLVPTSEWPPEHELCAERVALLNARWSLLDDSAGSQ
ncbi:MAG: hypothetical protein QM661_14760 [Solimonas sp.]